MGQLLPWLPAPEQVAIPLVFLLSFAAVWWLDRPRGRWGRTLRSRFLFGLPWGTLVSVLGVLAVYLFVQDGLVRWRHPLTLPFSSWSYLYPTGWLLAPFSHTGPGHLIGNLTTTLAVAPLAEYFFGHFPHARGRRSFESWRTNPYVRAFVLFPLGVFLVGLATSVFAWGPIIGFSGVAFAFAGFALVRYPLGTVVALSVQELVRTVYQALLDPVTPGAAREVFQTPWWYGIAVQGHALGLFLGVLLGVLVLYRRDETPSALRLWTGATVLGISMTLWALWWYRGGSTYVLYRGFGVVFVVAVALLFTVAAVAGDRPLPAWPSRRRALLGFDVLLVLGWVAWGALGSSPAGLRTLSLGVAGLRIGAVSALFGAAVVAVSTGAALSSERPLLPRSVTRKQAALVCLLVPLAAMVGVAGVVNATQVTDDAGVPGDGPAVSVGDYSVTYAESVPNEKVSVVDVSLFGETTNVETSGVIVVNPDREIWAVPVSKGRLAFRGRAGVRVGGIGWSEVVRVRRAGWSTVHGGTAYQVWLRGPDDSTWTHAFASNPATAGATLANRKVTVVPQGGAFLLRVTRNNSTLATVPLPKKGANATAAGLRFERRGGRLFAETNGTRIRIAATERSGT